MELDDGAFPLLEGIIATTDQVTAFKGVDVVIMVGAFPRSKGTSTHVFSTNWPSGMERKDLLQKNAAIFKSQGALIEKYAARNVKVDCCCYSKLTSVRCWLWVTQPIQTA